MDHGKIERIDAASMRILSNTGMRFLHPDARAILKDHGVDVADDGLAHFTEAQIREWVAKAPATARIFAFDPAHDVSIGEDRSYNAQAASTVIIREADGTRRKPTLEDFSKVLKLYETNPAYHINGGIPVQPGDIPSDWSTLMLYYIVLRHSSKALWSGTGKYEQMQAVIEMTCARYGATLEELADKPRMMAVINTLSPLEFDLPMTETLLACAKYHQPVVITPAGMAGTTAPMTLAGTIAVGNAEIIAAVVLSQMYAPGTPVLYGSASTTADMRSGAIAAGAPEGALCYSYAAEMARFYGLPSRAGGALTDAKKVDAQAGYESMMNYFACRQAGVNLILHSSGVLNSYLDFSFEQLMVDFEIIDYIDRFMRDIDVDEETIPEEVIDEVGQGGSYIMEDHTMEHCRTEALTPAISARGSIEDPDGALERNIQVQMARRLSEYEAPEIDEGTLENMRQVMRDHGIDDETIARLDAVC